MEENKALTKLAMLKHTEGDYSPASMNGNVSMGESAVMKERVKLLEQLLEEKERTIKILMSK